MDLCQSCGACCAAFRVSFHVSERDDEPGGTVPEALADEETATTCRMRGTDRSPPRCVALVGKVGEAVRCGIYELRPGPCREFAPHGVFGVLNAACNQARARHGLAPLPDPVFRP
ncbi:MULTISPECIES: YkgJ family cysteine cluster protein [Niveibacterium]|uniref:YkgJ family cysteine cluster protein n=1 Tax=Niveibacterium microcysteis TaxID=2811415 RepID=A0ABX7M2T0_9RHOO|nr:YkgJ family cysteine cluster protein [Niveibacterium microcysteis]QSI75468.1 YkgJ family cysteine cluster protein [Niveibacterium microcysteis]